MRRLTVSVTPMLAVAMVGAAVGFSTANASAQTWQAGTANSNMNGTVVGLKVWDPDGPSGPLPPVLAAFGVFTAAGTTSPANHIATWDGTNWSTFPGNGLSYSGTSGALAILSSNNNLVCAGTGFSSADGVPNTKGVARWDPASSSWSALDDTSSVLALVSVAAVNADTVVVVGSISAINGVSAKNVAMWNTSTGWSALGSGVSSLASSCLGLSNGDIIVSHGGEASGDSSVTLHRIGRWDGTAWHPMGAGFTLGLNGTSSAGIARCLLELPNGDVIAGGSLVASGTTGLNKIARWDHVNDVWLPLGAGINTEVSNRDVYAVVIMHNGDLVVGGDFNTAGGATQNYIARWNFSTSTWSGLAPGDVGLGGPVRSLAVLPNGDLAVGGDFLTAGGQPAQRFAIWHEPGVAVTHPTITVEPTSQHICIFPGGVGVFNLTATGGDLTYQWQQQDLGDTFPGFIDITDGPVLDIFGHPIFTAAGTTTNQLTLTDGQGYAQVFRCVVTNTAGSAESDEVTLSYCQADFDCSGALGVPDIFAFLTAWFDGDPRADFNFTDGIGVQDIFDFLAAWFAGC